MPPTGSASKWPWPAWPTQNGTTTPAATLLRAKWPSGDGVTWKLGRAGFGGSPSNRVDLQRHYSRDAGRYGQAQPLQGRGGRRGEDHLRVLLVVQRVAFHRADEHGLGVEGLRGQGDGVVAVQAGGLGGEVGLADHG